MKTLVKCGGHIIFDPKDVTKKHHRQSIWKKTAMVDIRGDWSEYYAWFLQKKGLVLNPPLRKAHITFINDRFSEIKAKDRQKLWTDVSKMFTGKYVEFDLDLQPLSDGKHWWLTIPPDSRGELQAIRNILGLGQYKYGFHMTIGYVNSRPENQSHSNYLKTLFTNQYISYTMEREYIYFSRCHVEKE